MSFHEEMYFICPPFPPPHPSHPPLSDTYVCGDSAEYKDLEIGMSDECGKSIQNEKFETVVVLCKNASISWKH